MAWTDPRTWVSGETVTASVMNVHVRDNLKAIGDSWTSYTPTWGATVAPAIGNGSIVGKYLAAGKLIHYRVVITAGSTTTFGSGTYTITLPFTPEATTREVHMGSLFDSSGADTYPVYGLLLSGVLSLRTDATTAGNALRTVSATVPVTMANGDVLTIAGSYEAA